MSGHDERRAEMGSRPLCAIIPFREGTRYAALSGDGKPGEIVTEQTPSDVARYCAAMVASLKPGERRDVMRLMSSRLAEAGPKVFPMVPIAACLPDEATLEQDSKVINGLNLLLLALGSAPGDASVGTVTANAAAMASGTPYASDPLVGERQNEVVLAKAILEAALLGDEDAKRWFEDNHLSQALQDMVTYAAAGGSDQLPVQQAAQARLFEIYDCMQHNLPLGGTPVTGDFLKDLWSGLKTAAGNAILHSVGGEQGTASDTASTTPTSVSGAATDRKQKAEQNVEQASHALNEEVSKAKKALDDAKAAMEDGQESLSEYRSNLKNAALQSARLQWAQSILDVPDDVATILSATTPNMSDVSTFLQSVLAILPAAKETGSTSTLKSLLYAIKAATQSAGGDGTLYSLLQGDPSTDSAAAIVVADAPEWMHTLREARDEQSAIAGSGVAKEMLAEEEAATLDDDRDGGKDVGSSSPVEETAPEGIVDNDINQERS